MTTAATLGAEPAKKIRAGMIGLDTSHVVAFTKVLNDPKGTGDVGDVDVVAAFPGGSPDIASSRDRVEGFTKDMRKMGVEIVDSIDAVIAKVDVVMIMSVDGRPHLAQARPVFAAGKRVYIDKPLAGSLADAIAIFKLAQKHKVPCFTSSSLRFSPGILGMRNHPLLGDVLGCDAYGPCHLEKTHPDLFWYGVHGVETLYTIMGTGCESVTRVHADGVDFVTGTWKGGRVGTFRGIRAGKPDYGATVFGTKGNATAGKYAGYEPLVVEIAKFFKSGEPPVAAAETLEMFTFMEAADESKRQGGKPVTLASVREKAEKEAARIVEGRGQ